MPICQMRRKRRARGAGGSAWTRATRNLAQPDGVRGLLPVRITQCFGGWQTRLPQQGLASSLEGTLGSPECPLTPGNPEHSHSEATQDSMPSPLENAPGDLGPLQTVSSGASSGPWPARTSRGAAFRHGLPPSGPADVCRVGARAHRYTQLWKRSRSPARAGAGGAGLPGPGPLEFKATDVVEAVSRVPTGLKRAARAGRSWAEGRSLG